MSIVLGLGKRRQDDKEFKVILHRDLEASLGYTRPLKENKCKMGRVEEEGKEKARKEGLEVWKREGENGGGVKKRGGGERKDKGGNTQMAKKHLRK